jgi:MFS family permease
VPTSSRSTAPEHPQAILAIILVSYFMIVLDNSIIFTALPSIEAAMGFSATGLSWVQNAYTLVFGGLLLLGARAGDLLGRRRVFIAGLAVFALASFLIGVAPTGWWLIAARALQGIGASVVAPSALSLLTANFAGEQRTRAVAAYGTVAGIGASVGLVLGGAVADLISWRAGFFLNVPIGAAMMVAAVRYLPDTSRSTGRVRPGRGAVRDAGHGRAGLRHRALHRRRVERPGDRHRPRRRRRAAGRARGQRGAG